MEKEENILGYEKIGKLIRKFSIPCIISLLVNSLYNIVDQIFIGWGVGYLGNGATNVVFPLTMICLAFALMFGDGASAYLSLKLGQKKNEEAAKGIGNGISLSVIISIILFTIIELFLPILLNVFGCTDEFMSYALSYGRIIGVGLPFMIIGTTLNSMIRADGKPKYAMTSMVIGAILNVILDPIFIFAFKKGVEGAAIATVISQIVTFVINILYIKKFQSIKLNKKSFRPNSKKYDCAISYNDGVELYYMVDCLCANVKIAWNHTNYTNSFTYKPTLDKFYYDRVNYIVTISEECAYTLKRVFPENADKVRIIENIVLKDTLMSLAEVENPYDSYSIDRDTTVICTVAGLYVRKGFDYASVALGNLKKEGIKFLWFIVGGGPEENEIKDLVRNNNIENETFFLHQQSNPYKFVKWADIFLLTSHAEGKSIAIEEAKLLEKPILITHFASAFDQIESGKSGLVAEMTNDSVTEKLRMLIGDKDLQTNLSNYLKNNTHSNRDKNINALYSLINS